MWLILPCCFTEGNESEIKERISDTTESGISQPAATLVIAASANILSPLEVSLQSLLQPTDSVLARYKQYLQSCYNARTLAPADKYLPTLKAPYINLAMIRRGYYGIGERDEFTRRTLHGGVDQILASKTPISIRDLLSPEKGEPVRFILVEGPPGIGKSTFAWEVCRRWDEIESLRDYQAMVLLKLREKWVLNAESLSNLFRYPSHPDFSNSIADELVKSQGQSLLLVLDGFDEVSHSFHENSVIKSILCRQLLPECTVILTTRPVAKATLESICQPQVDKHVEIIGFTEEERVRYITEVFSEEQELQVNFLKYMFLVPHIKSMMYIPLNCAIIAQVYYESQSSHHLAIPRTRTQLYKALTHSLLVRHIKMKGNDLEYTFTLPEGLKKDDFEMFKNLARFAFNSYHEGKSKVTFFKEDIPEGLVHFGFMNESTEMYAGKGVERTFSFLHLSLQEYLAAWHLADNYRIEFQVAYHRLALSPYLKYKGDNKEEKALLSSLQQQRSSLVQPALFLAGITGWKCQSEDDKNHWEMYLSDDTTSVSQRLLVQSLYEAQNPTLLSHYFATGGDRTNVSIHDSLEPYTCYALSYCVAAHSSVPVNLIFDDGVTEIFVKGLNDNHKSITPIVRSLDVYSYKSNELFWIMKIALLCEVKVLSLSDLRERDISIARDFLQPFIKLQSLDIDLDSPTSWEWLAPLKSLHELKSLKIESYKESSPPPADLFCWTVEHSLTELVLDINLPSNTIYDLHSPTDVLVDSVLKSVLRSEQITKMVLPNVSRETMAGVHSILLHCPSLTTLELKRTRLGYDGILYICSALRKNTTLRQLAIHDDLQLPWLKDTFASMKRVPLSDKTTCTDFLLELNNILKDNTTLEEMKIQSGLFFPFSAGADWEYCQWTGLGPLQQFNVGAVGSGISPNLRRSFSSSDLTQPQTTLLWDRQYLQYTFSETSTEVNFKKLFSKRKEKGKKLFSLPSFTAPDTEVLQSFSGLDSRLKECLEISHLHQYVERLGETYESIKTKWRWELEPSSQEIISSLSSESGESGDTLWETYESIKTEWI